MTPPTTVRPEDVDARFTEVIDVRAPVEFAEDHLPGAINLPVLTDAERAEVGRIYKEDSPFAARRLGAGLIAANISGMFRGPFRERAPGYRPLVYCWRGGQRSMSLATILAAVGWPVSVLEGGYRAYRKFVREAITQLASDETGLRFRVIAGYTGTGKTRLLHEMRARGFTVLDLEGLANHRGSLLGSDPTRPEQPSQKAFENQIFQSLRPLADGPAPKKGTVFVESESNRVGNLHVPAALWTRIRSAAVTEIVVPRPARAGALLREYEHFRSRSSELLGLLHRLRDVAGGAKVDRWTTKIEAGHWTEFVEDILENHYDPAYARSRKRIYPSPSQQIVIDAMDEAGIDRAIAQLLSAGEKTPPLRPQASTSHITTALAAE